MSINKDGTLSLPSGVDVPFRLIQPDDVPALQRFHGRLSEKTVYLRFFGSLKELPKEKARFFAHVDGVDHLAFVAFDPDDPDEIIALVRYDRGPGSERAKSSPFPTSCSSSGKGLSFREGPESMERAAVQQPRPWVLDNQSGDEKRLRSRNRTPLSGEPAPASLVCVDSSHSFFRGSPWVTS